MSWIRKRAPRLAIVMVAVLAPAPVPVALALAPDKGIAQYVLDAWGLEDGLPQITVHAVERTSDGYLWVGTQEGLLRFDGAAFRLHDTSNTPGLGHDNIWALLEDRHGTLWIGTHGGGLTRMRDGAFTTLTERDGLPSDGVRSLHEDRRGALWVGTDEGLARIEGGQVTTFTTQDGLPHDHVNAIAEDAAGTLLFGTDDGGLVRLHDGRFTPYPAQPGLPDDDVNVVRIDRQGVLWAGTDGGLARIDRGLLTLFTRRDGLPHDWVNVLLEDRDGSLWVGTAGGICRMTAGRLEAAASGDGPASDNILALFEDHEGRVWLGTVGRGLARLKDGAAATYGPAEGLSYAIVSPILEDRRGTLWVGTYGGGLNRLRDGRWTSYSARDGLPDGAITALLEDRQGTLWVGTRRGLSHFADGTFRAIGPSDAASRAPVRALAEGRDGSLWIGTYGEGVLRYREGRVLRYGREQGLSHELVQAIREDARGVVWVGTDGGGLNRFDGERFVPIGQDGDPADSVMALHETASGELWAGTDAGICRVTGDRLACFGPREGLYDDVVYQILEDGQGDLWLSCNKGIYRVAQRDLDDLAAGRRTSIVSVAYGRADGMRGVECNGGVQPAGWRTRDGALWFPTTEGAVRIDPGRAVTTGSAPPLTIERALIDEREVDPRRAGPLPPGRGSLEFHYAAIDLGDSQRVAYRYRLEGFDDHWIEAGSRRAAFYTNVPPGSYRFQVAATRTDGAWDGAEASLPFTLRARFWQTPAFYALCAAGVLLAAWGAYRLRVRTLRTRHRELEALVQDRTRSLVDATRRLEEAQARQADFVSGVSHALKTPLTLIRLYGETLHQGEGFSEADRLSYYEIITRESERLTRLIERVLDFSRVDRGDKRYQLEPGDLAAVVRQVLDIVGRHLKRQGFEVEVDVEPDLPAARFDRDAVVDAVLNLVDNAAKYSGESRYVGIRLRSDGARIVCEVEDRGLGIPEGEREHLFTKFHRGRDAAGKGGYGLGLFLVRHIMDAHGGEIEVESQVGRGSRFRLVFPAAAPSAAKPAAAPSAAAAGAAGGSGT